MVQPAGRLTMYIAVFAVLVNGASVGEMRLSEPVVLEECKMDLENDRHGVLESIRMSIPDAELDAGKCVPAGIDL